MNNLVSQNINIEFWYKDYCVHMARKNVDTIDEYIVN